MDIDSKQRVELQGDHGVLKRKVPYKQLRPFLSTKINKRKATELDEEDENLEDRVPDIDFKEVVDKLPDIKYEMPQPEFNAKRLHYNHLDEESNLDSEDLVEMLNKESDLESEELPDIEVRKLQPELKSQQLFKEASDIEDQELPDLALTKTIECKREKMYHDDEELPDVGVSISLPKTDPENGKNKERKI